MTHDRVHRALSADGTEIVGRVEGRGPALVLVHGGIGDGDVAWDALVPHLAERFTCYVPSTRGRGLSGDSPDHSPPRLEEDVTAFVESIGEPVSLFGWSGGGPWALGVAERTAAVTGVAVYEPAVVAAMGEQDLARTAATMGEVGSAAADGRLVDAMRMFTAWICTDQEMVVMEQMGLVARWATQIPAMLRFMQQDASYVGVRSTDPSALRSISTPLLLLRGGATQRRTWFVDAEAQVAAHVARAEARELPGIGHFAPVLAPERLATELLQFFAVDARAAVR